MIGRRTLVIGCLLLICMLVFGCSKPTDEDDKAIITVSPNSAELGQTLAVVVQSDEPLDVANPVVTVAPQEGISLANVQKVRPRQFTFQMTVSSVAPLGKHVLSLKAGDIHGEAKFVITDKVVIDTDTGATIDFNTDIDSVPVDTVADSGSDTIVILPAIEVRPASLLSGQETRISLFGRHTHFSDATTVSFSDKSGLTVTSNEFMGPTLSDGDQLVIVVDADANATPGNQIGTVTSVFGNEIETAYFSIEVFPGPKMSASPMRGYPGENNPVILSGSGTNFIGESPATLLLIEPVSHGVSINLDSINSDVELATTVYISEDAIPGEYKISAETILESGKTEMVVAPFTVIDSETDTSGQANDSDVTGNGHCNDFTVEPAVVSVGAFNRILRLNANREVSWDDNDKSVSLNGENAHLYLGELNETAEEKCYVVTSKDMSCSLNVGLQAIPGDYEIHATSNGVTSCGTLTVTGDDIKAIEIPASHLPLYNTYTGALDGASNTADFYQFDVSAGTTAIFHASSLDRMNMDPVLRLIDAGGDSWIAFNDDETPLGIDARMVFHFREDGVYHLAVEPKLVDDSGDYQLYTYLLTHGNVSFETEADHDTFETAQIISNPVGSVVHATMDTTDNVDYYYFETTGPATVGVVARRLALNDNGFADTRITLYDSTQMELDSGSAWYEIPSTADPRLFVIDAGGYYVKVEAEEETSGFYALNIRPYLVINELDNSANSGTPWIELQGYYNLDLTGYELCAFDGNGIEIDSSTPCVDLTGFVTDADGYTVVYADDFTSSSLMLPAGPGAVSLRYQGTIIDSVQYGEVGSNDFGEGSPADVGSTRSIGRAAGVDSNNNKLDFVYMASPSPGMPNDRTYQSPVPLYGEPVD